MAKKTSKSSTSPIQLSPEDYSALVIALQRRALAEQAAKDTIALAERAVGLAKQQHMSAHASVLSLAKKLGLPERFELDEENRTVVPTQAAAS